ncbi:CG14689 [Drosophila busckii]|uniref:CG14689 n=1 Tax=Drosophila busckii TaxID=30019 RepID=A0A0M4EU46_DROBS|nr:uncharacterized protein LOC108596144 [Drosophila busckii]ALC41150.1 CG14689 [Drosophila busckii]
MKRIYADNYVPKYQSGKWSWDSESEGLHFEAHHDLEHARERFIETCGYNFLRTVNQEEEMIFRQEFMRSETTHDADTIVINDVRDLVLFFMPKEFLSLKFLNFMHQPAVHRLLHALIIYFEHYLRLVEFVLIRRDELTGHAAQIQSEQTNEIKRTLSIYLSQYRMLVARNYSIIVKGEGDMKKFYHTKEIVNISSPIKDKLFYEQFMAVATQIVWITMHRRAYHVIEMEMSRLFRSEHFVSNRPGYPKFSPVERCLLYGRNNKMKNYRAQTSPLVQELKNVADEDTPILWIGERKYRGTDLRIAEIELEYIVPGPQLYMIDMARGILGHPKSLYDTILTLDWPSVRYANYSLEDDPHQLLRQPYIRLPNINEQTLRRMQKQYEHFFNLHRIYEPTSIEVLRKWFRREEILNFYRSGGMLTNITLRCENELVSQKYGEPVEEIMTKYRKAVTKFRKRKSVTNKKAEKTGDDYYFEE